MADRREALIVATGEYEHDGLRDLRSAAADARALAGVLADPAIGGFAVDVLRDGSAHEVRSRVEDFFADRRPGDVLLLHLSCHGLKGESGELYFTARDTRPQRLASTAISADFVQHCLRMSRSRCVVVLLDCCYGGAFAKGVRVRAAGDIPVMDSFPTGRGRAVITASSAMEFAFEGDELADDHEPLPSVFTAALVEGLRTGEADLDGDGLVALDELYDYVFDRVRERNPAQTPTKSIEMSGDLYLARSRRQARLPEELRTALAAPNVFTRVGAVSGLRELMLGPDVPLAAAARRELERITGGEVPPVAAAARSALRELVVVPSTRVIELTGSRSSHLLQLDGPPLARAGSWQVSDPRIMVRPGPDGLDVSVAAGPPLRGEIWLGDMRIRVVADETARREVKIGAKRPQWNMDTVSAVLFALASLGLGVAAWTDHTTANHSFDYEVLAYVGLRLVQSFTTVMSVRRRYWVWCLCAIGAVAGIWGLLTHLPGLAVLFWPVAAVIEFFGRPIDRVRAALAAAASAPSIAIMATTSGPSSPTGFIVYVLNGVLAILLGLVTVLPVLARRIR